MALSKPLLTLCQKKKLKPTPAAVKEFIERLIEQRYDWKDIAVVCEVSTKTLRQWRKEFGF